MKQSEYPFQQTGLTLHHVSLHGLLSFLLQFTRQGDIEH